MKKILVSQRVDYSNKNDEKRNSLDQRWTKFLLKCNLYPIFLSNNKRYLKILIKKEKFNGILITGGNPVIIGAALAGLVAVAGSLSGAHFNPAVSIMALVKGDLSQSDLMGYILAQILGALFALEIFKRFL